MEFLHPGAEGVDLPVDIRPQHCEGFIAEAVESGGDGRAQPAYDPGDLVDATLQHGKPLGKGGGVRLALQEPQLGIEGRCCGLDAPEQPRKLAARAFNRIAWPAFGLMVVTGVWNVVALDDPSESYQRTLML